MAPTNEAANDVNECMLKMLSNKCEEFFSCDSIHGGDASEEHYPVEFLNSIETGGLPPHKLSLCEGAVLMVIRNYAPHLGVRNGMRVRVRKMGNVSCTWLSSQAPNAETKCISNEAAAILRKTRIRRSHCADISSLCGGRGQ